MAVISELRGCRAWAETAGETLAELVTVAEQFILSYKDRGKALPDGIACSLTGQGRISGALWHIGNPKGLRHIQTAARLGVAVSCEGMNKGGDSSHAEILAHKNHGTPGGRIEIVD